MKIILTGYMGSGKSVVGKALAKEFGLNFMDLDAEISKIENKTILQIFKDSGEIYFRRKEAEVLDTLLERKEDFILALGGGTPCYGKNLQLIKDSPGTKLIYLKTGLNELHRRLLKEQEQRPLIKDLDSPEVLEDFIRKHLFERTYYYNQSDLIITTDDKGIEELTLEIKGKL